MTLRDRRRATPALPARRPSRPLGLLAGLLLGVVAGWVAGLVRVRVPQP